MSDMEFLYSPMPFFQSDSLHFAICLLSLATRPDVSNHASKDFLLQLERPFYKDHILIALSSAFLFFSVLAIAF